MASKYFAEALSRGVAKARNALPTRGYFSGGMFREQEVSKTKLDLERYDWMWHDGTARPFPILWTPEQNGKTAGWFLKGLALAFSGPALMWYLGYQMRKDDIPAVAPYFPQESKIAKRKVTA